MKKETKRNIIFYGTLVPFTFLLMIFNQLAGFMFCVGLMLGSLIEKSGWNDSHLK